MSCDMEISPNFEENRPLESKSSMEVTKSPTSQKNSIVDEEEKEKEINNSENEDQLKYYSTKLLEILKSTSSESEALQFINCCLIEYKSKSDTQPNIQIRGEIKQKYSDKDKKIFVDAFKKLASDNVLLKSSILKLVEKKDKNKAKAEKFDQLLQEYEKVISENEKLKKSVDILKYAAKDKCLDVSYQNYHSFGRGSGGPGIF